MEPLTREDCLRKVREHFERPDAKLGWDSDIGACVYRKNNDLASPIRCAFGVLIPDELYRPAMEGIAASSLYKGTNERFTEPLASLFADDVSGEWLDSLQVIHDEIASIDSNTAEFLNELDRSIEAGTI